MVRWPAFFMGLYMRKSKASKIQGVNKSVYHPHKGIRNNYLFIAEHEHLGTVLSLYVWHNSLFD
jgi:hypothetical protein